MINIKYCGNCNPDIHPKDVKKALEALLAVDIPRKYISIMVNGCSRACLTKKNPANDAKGKTIIISSQEVLDKQFKPYELLLRRKGDPTTRTGVNPGNSE